MHGDLDEPAIEWRDVSVRYGSVHALDHVNLHLHPGELVALVGPNGAGKTTLLHTATGSVRYTGEIVVHQPGPHGLAFVPQRHGLDVQFPITAEQVVALGRRPFRGIARRLRPADREVIAWALETVGLPGVGKRLISEFSGGQLQRVLFARALAQEAKVLLLDEPFSGVDAPTARELVALLNDLRGSGTAIIVSTHDLALVRERFERAVLLGRAVRADGPPDEVLSASGLETFFSMEPV